MQNEFVEFHDSTIGAIRAEGADVVVTLTPAYVHRSHGTPGVDPGTGWSANVRITVNGGRVTQRDASFPVKISAGEITIGSMKMENGLPLPLATSEPVELELVLASGGEVRIVGTGCTAEALGDYAFIECFP